MTTVPQQPLVSGLIALQFVAFGWRINREITVGDQYRKTWLPLPDFMNLVALLAAAISCVALPLACDVTRFSSTILSMGYVLIAFHPISEAAHYRLFSKAGRSIYKNAGRDYPWITDQEIFTVISSLLFSLVTGFMSWSASK